MSFSSPGEHRFGNKWRPKRVRVLPSKFLLGGSITDPLNLGSLDKEAAQGTAETSTAVGGGAAISKRSAAVRVIIPPNINDPLNLDASSDNEDLHTDALQRQMRRRRRRVSICCNKVEIFILKVARLYNMVNIIPVHPFLGYIGKLVPEETWGG
ncbi:putative RNA methyltransferase bin3 [Portunus trituberculatus]|uniref:Putative RNA methyltransferase bin3 n=1 Tax=Portunus trituberculatus TaxID=210409 RepID=A0A5B7J729_PORTR|nr:putative RNA methyltransferase bin3 [Portunus trituberculatus]